MMTSGMGCEGHSREKIESPSPSISPSFPLTTSERENFGNLILPPSANLQLADLFKPDWGLPLTAACQVTRIIVMLPRYELIYAEATFQHIAAIERRYHSLVRRIIEQQLRYEPNVRTRNRKPLIKPSRFGEAWELRLGPGNRFRVFYRTEEDVSRVRVLAIAVKIGGKLYIGGKEFIP